MSECIMSLQLGGEEDRRARLANRAALEAAGYDLFPAEGFHPSHCVKDLPKLFLVHQDLDLAARPILRIAGRLIARRHVGGVWFADLWQEHAKIQLRVRRDAVERQTWFLIGHLDIGDFLGAVGRLVTTQRGELTLDVQYLSILGKPVTTPAIGKIARDGKRHGAQSDRGALLRERRHIAMMTDSTIFNNLRAHAKIIQVFRRIMEQEGFVELQTSIVGPFYGGAAATPFTTNSKALGSDLYLRVSPEPDLKRALSGGLERVYEIGRNFRNEGLDATHQPSFTAFECYAAWLDYRDMMELTERIVVAAVQEVRGSTRIRNDDMVIDFEPPWPRHRMVDLVAHELQTTSDDLTLERLEYAWNVRQSLDKKASAAQAPARPESWGELLVAFFEDFIEDSLVGPCFVIDHPVETSPLTKRHRYDKRLTERFELYVSGMEIANAYSELNDPIEQRKRLEEQDLLRDEPYGVDEFFLNAIDDGMPQAGGLGIGLDRLAMVITGAKRIVDVIPFPLVK